MPVNRLRGRDDFIGGPGGGQIQGIGNSTGLMWRVRTLGIDHQHALTHIAFAWAVMNAAVSSHWRRRDSPYRSEYQASTAVEAASPFSTAVWHAREFFDALVVNPDLSTPR